MIRKIKKSLKNAPVHNYFCIINASLGKEFENKDNAFIYGDNELVLLKKRNFQEKIDKKHKADLFKTYIDTEGWRGCVCYVPDKCGKMIIHTVGFPENSIYNLSQYMESAIKLIQKWMDENEEDVCITESLFDSLGPKHSKTIRKIVINTFENSKQTLYIARKNKK